MSALSILLSVLFTGLVGSYTWGMRGCVIGGEKGAMLPGALLGYCIAMLCGEGALSEFYPFFCAAGALSMFYGGTETYGQTLSFILSRDNKESFAYNKAEKGAIGVFLKGGLWFSIFAMMLAMLPSALNRTYGKTEIIIMLVLIPFVSIAGTKIFNSPYNKEKGLFPKLYFSHNRREEWGGNVLIIGELTVFSLLNRDYFSVFSALIGFILGGLGFLLGLLTYDFCERKHNGKYFFGKLQEKGYIDGWKIMEHFFGAFSGGGVMLWFCLNSDHFTEKISDFTIIKGGNTDTLSAVFVVVMLLLTAMQYPIVSVYKRKSGKEPDLNFFELLERPLLSAIPLIFVFSGYYNASLCISFVSLIYVLCEKCGLEWFSRFSSAKKIAVLYSVLFCVSVLYAFLSGFAISPFILVSVLIAVYTLSELLHTNIKENRVDRKNKGLGCIEYNKSTFTVDCHFLLESVAIIAVAKFLG